MILIGRTDGHFYVVTIERHTYVLPTLQFWTSEPSEELRRKINKRLAKAMRL